MGTLTAAVVLAWIVLVLLCFAVAGLLHQLRTVRAILRRQGAVGRYARASRPELPMSVLPRDGSTRSAVLLVDDHCPVCAEIAPVFADIARSGPAEMDFVAVGYAANDKWEALDGIRYLPDADAFHVLDPDAA